MKVLVLCERSGAIRNAFARLGHDVTSVDTLESTTDCEGNSRHIVGDALEWVGPDAPSFDLVIARPPCTYLTNSGVRWLFEGTKVVDGMIVEGELTARALQRWQLLGDAIDFFRAMKTANAPHIAIENPIPHKYAREGFETSVAGGHNVHRTGRTEGIGSPSQIVQPWMFGSPESKATGWWITGLPELVGTENVYEHMMTLPKAERNRVHFASPGADRWMKRSLLVEGMAVAMAEQWTAAIES